MVSPTPKAAAIESIGYLLTESEADSKYGDIINRITVDGEHVI
jgi:hypothetical protein